jgi:hypothetical protein
MHLRMSIIALVFAAASSCAAIRTSSRDYLTEEESKLVAEGNLDEVSERVTKIFRSWGAAAMKPKQLSDDERLLTFVKVRGTIQTLTRSYYGNYNNSVTPYGSIYFVHLWRTDENKVVAVFFGKPTRNGTSTCTDFDDEYTRCEDGDHHRDAEVLSGRDESSMIQGILHDYQRRLDREGSPSTAATPPPSL